MQNTDNKKQSTLFQSWGKARQTNPSQNIIRNDGPSVDKEVVEIDDSDDEELFRAIEESMLDYNVQQQNSNRNEQNKLYQLCQPSTSTAVQRLPENDLPGFDMEAGRTWVYPTNFPVREYQFQIVQKALYTNTMVVLPTGLGKTFIAAVIMYNFYRWYPQGKVVFMAPTRPLVAQQIEACFKIMGISQKDTVIMTGTVAPDIRRNSWSSGRVFFLTPQVLTNDLSRGICPARSIRCLIVDEAHKALGNYAYCQVVKELSNHTDQFRIVALSATPGSDMKAVEQVLKNLLISEVELRSEDSPDIQPYTHQRAIEKTVVPLGEELQALINSFLKVLEVYMDRLSRRGAMTYRNPANLSKFFVLKAKEGFCQNPPGDISKAYFSSIQTDFSLLISLCHAFELLQLHGMRSFYRFIKGIVDGEKSIPKARNELLQNEDFENIYNSLTEKFINVSFSANVMNTSVLSQLWNKEFTNANAEPFVYGHPKLQKLEEILIQHFQKCKSEDGGERYKNTRVMVFSQFRDSVEEINEMLKHCRPLVRAMTFVGQGSANGASKGLTQKAQMKVVQAFKAGGFNTLISTCVGEEGLDIGEVDLIICYDAPKSPIRLVQRMGRTGRKREGRIVVLLAQGKEEHMYNQSLYRKNSIHKAISSTKMYQGLNHQSPRMVPQHINPVCHKVYITVKSYEEGSRKLANKKRNGNHSAGKSGKKECILNTEELEHWQKHLRLPPDKVPTLKPPRYLYLEKIYKTKQSPAVSNISSDKKKPYLRLSEWLPWQNALQKAHLSGHSSRTQTFVNLMIMSQVQGQLAEDEDPYGLEMSAHLQQADVLMPGENDVYGNEHITSYFKAGAKPKNNTVEKSGVAKRKCSDREESIPKKKNRLEEVSPVSVREKMHQACPWDVIDDDDFVTDHAVQKSQNSQRELGTKIFEDVDVGCASRDAVVAVQNKGIKPSSSFSLIKKLPVDECCEFLVTETLSSDDIKAIACSNLYVPDVQARMAESEDVKFYEPTSEEPNNCNSPVVDLDSEDEQILTSIQDDEVVSDLNSEDERILSSIPENFEGHGADGELRANLQSPGNDLDSEEERILSSIPQEALEERGVPETHKLGRTCEADDLLKKPVSPINNHVGSSGVPGSEKYSHFEDKKDSDDECELIFSGFDLKSLMHTDNAPKNGVKMVSSKTRALVTTIEGSSPPHTGTSKLFSLQTSTPKSCQKTRVRASLSEQSPFNSQRHGLNPGSKTVSSAVVLTPVKKVTSPEKPPKNVSISLGGNFSSVLFDESSRLQQASMNKEAVTDKPDNSGDNDPGKSIPRGSQDLLTVTQMVSLINRSHREKYNTSTKSELLKSPMSKVQSSSCKTERADTPVFDLGFNLECIDEIYDDCDIQDREPLQEKAPCRTATEVNSRAVDSNDSSVSSACDKQKTVKDKSENNDGDLVSFNFGVDFSAFDEIFEEENVRNEVLEKPCTSDDKGVLANGSKRNEIFLTPSKLVNRHSVLKNTVNNSSRRSGSEASSDGEVVRAPVRRKLIVLDDCSDSSSAFQSPISKDKQKMKKKTGKRKEGAKCSFLNQEADISGWASTDDEDTSMDSYDTSFVDDQESNLNDVSCLGEEDMRAMYLRSVRSPILARQSKFKLQYDVDSRINVYSQPVPEESECYIEDSFCVNNDDVESVDLTEHEMDSPQPKVKLKVLNRPKKKRIMTIETSSEEERSPLKTHNRSSMVDTASILTAKASTSSSSFTQLKSPPAKMLPPLALFDRSCEKRTSSSPKVDRFSSTAAQSRKTEINKGTNQSLHDSERSFLTNNKLTSPKAGDNVLTVFVDTRELSGGQAVISLLRQHYASQVIAQRLAGDADYQVGTQVGVVRFSSKILSQVQKKVKVVEKIQNLMDYYDRPYLILEKSSCELFRNRNSDAILFHLLHTDVKVLYSASHEETAKLIFDLCQSEATRGFGINMGQCNTPHMQLYMCLPHVNNAVALNICKKFKNLKSFLSSTPSDIEKYGCISHRQAVKIHHFVHLVFM